MRIINIGDLALENNFIAGYIKDLSGEIQVEKAEWSSLEGYITSGDIILAQTGIKNTHEAVDAILKIKRNVPGAYIVLILPDRSGEALVNSMLESGADECVMPQHGKAHFEDVIKKYIKKVRGGTEIMNASDFGIVGNNEQMKFIINFMKRVAPSDIPVLIEGESGTGKELVAYGIHKASHRGAESFIPVNCGAIQKELMENEFFGHEKGSFTGANEGKKGLFELANNGTLFIDEIGEMELSAQVKLLRALETGRFMRVGGDKEIKVNVRIVAATNRNVKEEMRAGRFRKDLFYRLSAIMIKLPPLKDRRDDIPVLCDNFLKHSKIMPEVAYLKRIDKQAMNVLCSYDWPGNVRELLNVIDRAIVLSGEKIDITTEDLPEYILEKDMPRLNFPAAPASGSENMNLGYYMDSMEKEFIRAVLKKYDNDKIMAAESMQISIANLYKKIKKYGLS
jgi:transcriptional regulator with PAS, ATPase and Fis domain